MLSNGNILLRNFKESDKFQIAEICNNKNIWNNVRDFLPSPYTVQDAEDFIKLCQDENLQTNFVIEFEGNYVGSVGLTLQKDIYRLNAEIGYLIGEQYWNKGIATAAVNLIVDYAFNNLDLIRIYASVFDFNKGSQRVLEKSGFKLDCIFEKSIIKNNKIIDEYRYSKINENYKITTQ